MIRVVTALQVLMVLAWAIPLVLFGKYAWCKSTGPLDTLRAAVWYVALAFAAFPFRWFVFGGSLAFMSPLELAVWSALYVLSTLAALFLTSATYEVCRALN